MQVASSRLGWWSWANPAYILFFLMLFTPTAYPELKGAFLGIVAFIVLAACVWQGPRSYRLHRSIVLWTLLLAGTGTAFSVHGLVNGAPGAIPMLTVYLLWPIVYCFLIGALTKWEHIEALLRVMNLGLISVSAYSAIFILNNVGVWPDSLYVELDQGQAIGFYEGFIQFNLYSVASLIFLTPFFVAALMNSRASGFPVRMVWLTISVTMGSIVSILSGRKALWVVLIITPFLVWLFKKFQPTLPNRRTASAWVPLSVVWVLMVVGTGYFFTAVDVTFDIENILGEILGGFDFTGAAGGVQGSGGAGGIERGEQLPALIEGWLNSPIFGNGLGAHASVIRSDVQPWAYELAYIAMLFHTGIVGVAIIASMLAWIYWRGLRILKEGGKLSAIMSPTLVGLTCFLIANATNPYLFKFDYMWVLFWPLALINFHLLKSKNDRVRTLGPSRVSGTDGQTSGDVPKPLMPPDIGNRHSTGIKLGSPQYGQVVNSRFLTD